MTVKFTVCSWVYQDWLVLLEYTKSKLYRVRKYLDEGSISLNKMKTQEENVCRLLSAISEYVYLKYVVAKLYTMGTKACNINKANPFN